LAKKSRHQVFIRLRLALRGEALHHVIVKKAKELGLAGCTVIRVWKGSA